MKRTLHSLAALVVAAALPVVPLKAQVSLFVGGGAAIPMMDLADDDAKTGWLGFAGVDMPIKSLPGAAVGLTGIYAHMAYDDEHDDATNVPGVFADIAYLIGATSASRIKPYVRAGVGVIQHRYDPGGYGGDSESETKAAGAIGAGLQFMMKPVAPFVGVQFITGGSDTSFLAAYVGISFGGGGSSPSMRRK